MIAYKYNEESKIYEKEVNCQLDQLESRAAGYDIWLLPANSTYIEPLAPKEGFDVVFNGKNWEYKEQPKPTPPTPEEEKERRIAELKAQLSATDYKIIKCSEYSLNGQELPYDIAALHEERQAIRDEINRLESEV